MAGISGWMSVNSIDGNKVPYNEKVYFVNTTDLITDTSAWAAAFLADYDAVIAGQIDKVWLHIPLTLPGGLKSAPVAGSNNAVGALEKFDTSLSGEPYSYWFPSWITAGFQSLHQNLVDLTQAAVVTFNALLLGTTSNTKVTDEDGNTLSGTNPSRAVKSDRKQRRALGRVR